MTYRGLILPGLLSALVLSTPLAAAAQPDAAQPDAAQPGTARAHFERGVALFDEGRHDAALAEFEAAYEAAPNFRVLYNLAQVHARLGHAVEAVDAYTRFLAEGGAEIPAAQRTQAESELATQQARIGGLNITAAAPGASINVDGSFVARTPLSAPIQVSVGEHTVEVTAAGYQPQQRRVSVAGQDVVDVAFTLVETGSARGSLRVTSPLRDVQIAIDGEVRGRTPLDGSLSVPAGLREVTATRPGYLSQRRSVEVGMGAEAELSFELEADLAAADVLGQLTVLVPPSASVFLDGQPVDPPGPFRLPVGDHELRVEMPEVVPSIQRVDVEADATIDVEPALRFTPVARAERLGEASTLRGVGAALSVIGGLFIAGGAALVIWNEVRANELNFDQRRADLTRCAPPPEVGSSCIGTALPAGTTLRDYAEVFDATQAEFNGEVTEYNAISGLGYAFIVVGAGSILGSVILLVSTPSDEDAASVRARVGPGGLVVDGTF